MTRLDIVTFFHFLINFTYFTLSISILHVTFRLYIFFSVKMKWSRWHEQTYEASTLASIASWSIDMFENLYFRCGWMGSALKIAWGCSAAFNPRGGMLLYFRSSPKYSYLDFPIWHIWQVCRIAVHLRAKLSADVCDPKFPAPWMAKNFEKCRIT